jgi:hypothetical protein
MTPTKDKDGLPLHTDDCPEYDGKRCRLVGFRPDHFCEPALIEEKERARVLAIQVEQLNREVSTLTIERDRLAGQVARVRELLGRWDEEQPGYDVCHGCREDLRFALDGDAKEG